jgi:hypothetical protein
LNNFGVHTIFRLLKPVKEHLKSKHGILYPVLCFYKSDKIKNFGFLSNRNGTFGIRNGIFGVRNGIFGVRNDIFGVCNDIFGDRNCIFGVRNGIFGVRNSIFGVRNGIFGVCNDIFGIRNGIFGVCNDIFGVCNSILKLPDKHQIIEECKFNIINTTTIPGVFKRNPFNRREHKEGTKHIKLKQCFSVLCDLCVTPLRSLWLMDFNLVNHPGDDNQKCIIYILKLYLIFSSTNLKN